MGVEKKKNAIINWKNGPRTTVLSKQFDELSSGNEGKPILNRILPIDDFLTNKNGLSLFYNEYSKFRGYFADHYISSIPYILEEDCRIGNGILKYLKEISEEENRITKLQTIESAEAVQARAIVSLSEGKIISLSNSPTIKNMEVFNSNCPTGSFFHAGSFFDIDNEFLSKHVLLNPFAEGIDIILESMGFQMYGNNRAEQIGFVIENLSKNGIFICLEKCLQIDDNEYLKREKQKDIFKMKFFAEDQIIKKEEILKEMFKGQVLLETLLDALKKHFKHTYLLWNSGNFYQLAASNSLTNLNKFLNKISNPIIPNEFVYEKPRKLI